MNQWTTPDAYAGDVHDPMSQKPYMWNGNNPVQYSDPSGYLTVEVFDNHFMGGIGHAAIFITSGKGDAGKIYCLCGSKDKNPAWGKATFRIQDTNLRSLTRGVGKDEAARYDTGIVFNTTKQQEAAIASYFNADHAGKDHYNAIDHNCGQECSAALHDAGVLSGHQQGNMIPGLNEGHGGTSLKDIYNALLNNQAPPR